MALRPATKIKSREAEIETPRDPAHQRKKPEERYWLQVDRQTKRSFATLAPAEEAGEVIGERVPHQVAHVEQRAIPQRPPQRDHGAPRHAAPDGRQIEAAPRRHRRGNQRSRRRPSRSADGRTRSLPYRPSRRAQSTPSRPRPCSDRRPPRPRHSCARRANSRKRRRSSPRRRWAYSRVPCRRSSRIGRGRFQSCRTASSRRERNQESRPAARRPQAGTTRV